MRINNEAINEIRGKAKKFFVGASGCHDWSHVERVLGLALGIAKKEKADIGIVKIAVYLHDIGRKEEMITGGKICHEEKGAELAERILSQYDFDEKIKDNIKHCILSHRYRNDRKPETIEAKILFDADKLDSIGAVGVARDFLFVGHSGSNCLYTGNEKRLAKNAANYSFTKEDSALLEYYYKLKKVKSKMLTKTGKKIAAGRHDYMVGFFRRFEKEIRGLL